MSPRMAPTMIPVGPSSGWRPWASPPDHGPDSVSDVDGQVDGDKQGNEQHDGDAVEGLVRHQLDLTPAMAGPSGRRVVV